MGKKLAWWNNTPLLERVSLAHQLISAAMACVRSRMRSKPPRLDYASTTISRARLPSGLHATSGSWQISPLRDLPEFVETWASGERQLSLECVVDDELYQDQAHRNISVYRSDQAIGGEHIVAKYTGPYTVTSKKS